MSPGTDPPALRLLRQLVRLPWDHPMFAGGEKGGVVESLAMLDKIVVNEFRLVHALAARTGTGYREAGRDLRYGGEDAPWPALEGPSVRYVLDYTHNPPVDPDYPVGPGLRTAHLVSLVLHRDDDRIVTRTYARCEDAERGQRIFTPPLLVALSADGYGLLNPEAYPESQMYRLEEVTRLIDRTTRLTLYALSRPEHRLVAEDGPPEVIGTHTVFPNRIRTLTF
jgi:hypothetical protein